VEYFINLGTTIRSDARRTNKNKSRIVMAKAGFNKKEILFNSKRDLNLRKKFVNCYICSVVIYGGEILIHRRVDQK
jgi:hypothetical protein